MKKIDNEKKQRLIALCNSMKEYGYLDGIEELKSIFPELAESDDDKIIEGFYTLIRNIRRDGGLTLNKVPLDKCEAWLEKQKEQKPDIELIQRSWYMEGYHDGKFGNEPKWLVKTGEEGPKYELNPRYGQSLTENQKPAEWSDTDNIGWDEAFACVTRAEKAAKNEEELQNAVTAEKWLKEIKFKYYVHPVKQEWSEEDERVIRDACCWLAEYAGYLISENAYDTAEKLWKLSEKLKSLRPPMSDYKVGDKIIWDGKEYTIGACYPQPKQEWSEADEENISKLHRLLVICQGEKKFIPTSEYEKLDSWLTSLRPLWKPSEEQMKSLLNAEGKMREIGFIAIASNLAELYEQLKSIY